MDVYPIFGHPWLGEIFKRRAPFPGFLKEISSFTKGEELLLCQVEDTVSTCLNKLLRTKTPPVLLTSVP